MAKITLEDVKEQCAKANWTVDSLEYLNLDTYMDFRCPRGHEVTTSWKQLRTRFECPICCAEAQKNQNYGVDRLPPKAGTRILGLDQATHITGYAIIEDGKLLKAAAYKTKSQAEGKRLKELRWFLQDLLGRYDPDFVLIEGVQLQDPDEYSGPVIFSKLSRLQGVLIETLEEEGVPYNIVPVGEWRKENGVRGKSRADRKISMQSIVQHKYGIYISDDCCDAIGIATYGANHFRKPKNQA